MRRLPLILVTLVVAILATGCIRSDLAVTVNEDGSGTYTAIVAFNPKAFAEVAKMAGGDTGELGEDPCKEVRDSANENKGDLPSGAKIENYTDGDFCGVKITAPFAAGDNPSEEISKALGDISSTSEGVSGIGLDEFTLEKSGDGWTFQAVPAGADTSGGGTSSSDAAMMKQFLQGASSIVRIKLPGRVVEKDSNPDAIDGNGTLIWNLNLAGETRTLKARTEPGDVIKNKTYTDAGKDLPNIKGAGNGSSSSVGGGGDDGGSSKLPLIIGGLVVVAAIIGFVLWRKSKSGPAPALAGAGGGAVAAPGGPFPNGAPAGWTPPAPAEPAAWTPPAAPEPTAVAPAPTSPTDPAAPSASAPAATGAGAPGQPQWDPARNAYILWDAGSSKWLQYDNADGAWKPIE